jgi:hypothetical protein
MVKKQLLLTIFLLVCGFVSQAQPPKQATSSLLVNVVDRNGDAVRGLTKDNFRVKVNGHSAALLDVEYSLAPRRIVVLLDTSRSMAGQSEENKKWWIAREAIEDLLAKTPDDVQVALLTFSSQVHDVFDFSQGRSAVAAWLKRGPSQRSAIKGTTAFYDATVAAAKLLEPAHPGDSIYAITDGGDDSSHTSETDTKNRLTRSQIRLFLFLFREPMPTEEERSGADSVMELARDTGGFIFGVSAQSSLAASGQPSLGALDFDYGDDAKVRERIDLYTRALNTQVNGFYILQLDAAPSTRRSGKVSLEIVDGSGKVRKDVASTYQRALVTRDR